MGTPSALIALKLAVAKERCHALSNHLNALSRENSQPGVIHLLNAVSIRFPGLIVLWKLPLAVTFPTRN